MAQRELAEYIKREWKKFGMDPVEIKKYDVLLSFPTKPGSVTVVLGNGSVEFVSAPVEAPLIPQENVSGVPPPFNAYSPSGTVKVGDRPRANGVSLPSWLLCVSIPAGLTPCEKERFAYSILTDKLVQ